MPAARSRFSGQSDAARTLRDRLADAGYTAAGVAEARCVVYVAEPGPVDAAETDIDCAVRLSAEVADLVRRLAERDDRHPATLWIITRGVREAVSDAALRQSCLWGLAGVIGAEQPQLWGGLVDIPVGDDIGDCASALSTVLPTAAKSILVLRDGEFLAPALVPVSGQPVRETVAVSSRRGLPHHRRHGRTRPADGRLARGPRCTSSRPGWPHSVASQARLGQRHATTRTCATRSPRSGRWRCVASPSMPWPSTSDRATRCRLCSPGGTATGLRRYAVSYTLPESPKANS